MEIINTKNAPEAIGPYSQAIKAGGLLFLSGQIPINPHNQELMLFDGDVVQQAELVLSNASVVLKSVGLSVDSIVKTTIFLKDMADFVSVNEVYSSFMGSHRPARSTVAVSGLPKGVSVEIEVIAEC